MPRLYAFLLAAAAILTSTSLASAQFGGPPIMPSDGFRKSPPVQLVPKVPTKTAPFSSAWIGSATVVRAVRLIVEVTSHTGPPIVIPLL